MTLITHQQPAAVVHSPKAALDLPALAIVCSSAHQTPAFRFRACTLLKGRDGGLDAAAAQGAAKSRAVMSFVRHRLLQGTAIVRKVVIQPEFMRLRTVHVRADGQSVANDHCHHVQAPTEPRPTHGSASFLLRGLPRRIPFSAHTGMPFSVRRSSLRGQLQLLFFLGVSGAIITHHDRSDDIKRRSSAVNDS